MENKEPAEQEVKEAVDVLIRHLEGYWGFCPDSEFEFGCMACHANELRRKLESVASHFREG